MKTIGTIVLFTIFCSLSSFGQRKIDSKFGKGLYNVEAEDGSWSMKFGMRFQTLYTGENVINDSLGFQPGTSTFLIRRARLKFGGHAFSPKLKYKVELGLSNKDLGKVNGTTNQAPRMILDAVLKWNFYKNFTLWAGQTKLPGNRERVISSANMQFVDRSLLNKNYNIDRDIGMQLRHHTTLGKNFLIRSMYAISMGEGRNLVQDNIGGLQHTARVEFLPFGKFSGKGDYVGSAIKREEKPKLSVAFTYDYNDRASKTRSNQGSYMIDASGESATGFFHSNINTIFADMMFKYKGISVMGEYAMMGADVINHYNSDSTSTATVGAGTGLNLCLGYMFENNWEIAGRYTSITPNVDTGNENLAQYTFAVSRYIVGHALKVQADVSYLTENNSPDSELMYRLQIDIHF